MAHYTLTTQEFIRRATHIHAGVYDYTGTVFTRTRDPITFRCKQHGNITQAARHHLDGHGCPACNLGSGKHSPAAESKARAAALKEDGSGHQALVLLAKQGSAHPEVTAHLLKVLRYDAAAGRIVWSSVDKMREGAVASTARRDGYRIVSVLGKTYLEHRLVSLVVHGRWPTAVVDHMDHDPGNNRIENLRECNSKFNSENMVRTMVNKATDLPLGVFMKRSNTHKPSTVRACISHNGRQINLGGFPATPEGIAEAHAVYVTVKRMLHEGSTL
jgi:HNH endonuclease